MTVSLSPLARMQFNQGGIPLAGGKLFTYAAGTTTKLATYTDSTGSTPNTNPIILDANGQCDIWLTDTIAYKFVLSPSTDTDPPTNAYWTKDNISNIPSTTPTFTSATITGNLTVGGTINKVTITQPATGATLTIIDGKTLTASNTLTLTGTDGSSAAFGAGGTVAYKGSPLSQFAATTSAQLAGVISDETGTGSLVFATDPTFTLSDVTTNNVSTTAHGWCPKLPGNTTTVLRGDGQFAVPPSQNIARSARTSNTILGASDQGTLVDITSGTFTQTFTAAATLGNGWWCFLRNSGTGDITLDPNASETIDGLTSYIMYPQECRLVVCDGSAFYTEVIHPFYRAFTSSGTFTVPPGYSYFRGIGWSGGASGQRTNSAVTASKGGAAGGCAEFLLLASALGSSQSVTIGSGGTAVTTVASGNAGGSTSLGSLFTVYPGSSYLNGGSVVNGLINSITLNSPCGYEGISMQASPPTAIWGGGAPSDGTTAAGNSIFGGAAGGCLSSAAVVQSPGTSLIGGNGGPASSASNGTAGTAPGGGGGATQTGTQSGAGARGELRIWGVV